MFVCKITKNACTKCTFHFRLAETKVNKYMRKKIIEKYNKKTIQHEQK